MSASNLINNTTLATSVQPLGVASLDAAVAWWEPYRAAGKTLVTTNGCFDLLHVGHLRYLQAARQAGDALLVAVNTDASVNGLKPQTSGPPRPLVEEAERAELLAALRCVDAVVLFGDETPVKVLTALKPNVHVKGAQYTPETLLEAPLLASLGTRLVLVPMVAGRSTSDLVAKIRQ